MGEYFITKLLSLGAIPSLILDVGVWYLPFGYLVLHVAVQTSVWVSEPSCRGSDHSQLGILPSIWVS